MLYKVPMEFRVEPDLFVKFPGAHLAVAVIHGLDNERAPADLERHWTETWEHAGRIEVKNAQSHPRVNAWRETLKTAGISQKRFPTSIEAMLRRALKGGPPFSINPLVDFYNMLSLRHILPAGAFDLRATGSGIELRHTREGDHFTALDDDQGLEVPSGEIAYASGDVVLTRHFMWRQAREGLVIPTSRDVFLVSEVPAAAGEAAAEQDPRRFRCRASQLLRSRGADLHVAKRG